MYKNEFMTHTYATHRQIIYWIKNGAMIGKRNGIGSGHNIDYSMLDAQICNVLYELHSLMGSRESGQLVTNNLTMQLKNRPDFMQENDILFIGQYGNIAENFEIQGYVIDLVQIEKKMRRGAKNASNAVNG